MPGTRTGAGATRADGGRSALGAGARGWITWKAPEHPTKQIEVWTQVRAGLGSPEDEAVLISGEWAPSRDGPIPTLSRQSRCARPLAWHRLDWSAGTAGGADGTEQELRFAEQLWDCGVDALDGGEAGCWAVWFAEFGYRWEVVVIFLLDVWAGSLEECEASCQPKAEKGPSLPPSPEKLSRGAECGDAGCRASSDVPKSGFTSVGAWMGLCFGEGEVLLCVMAPSTFSSHSHLIRAVFSRRWSPQAAHGCRRRHQATAGAQSPRGTSPHGPSPPGQAGQACCAPTSPPAPCSAGGGGRSSPPSRLGTAWASRSPVPLSLLEVAVMVAELFEMLQRDFGYKVLLALVEKEELPEIRPGGNPVSLVQSHASWGLSQHSPHPAPQRWCFGELGLSHPECTSAFQQPKALHPSAVLSLDALLAFMYFDLNSCGYLHRREEELLGNLPLLPPAQVSHKVTVFSLGKLLEKARQPALPGKQNPCPGGQAGLTTA
ncbi:LOW QUALITY PROTEIN: cell cycle and apoptosis regulator protein 2 [Ciconia maguari]